MCATQCIGRLIPPCKGSRGSGGNALALALSNLSSNTLSIIVTVIVTVIVIESSFTLPAILASKPRSKGFKGSGVEPAA